MVNAASSFDRRGLLGVLTACGLAAGVPRIAGAAIPAADRFVRRDGMHLTRAGKPYRDGQGAV